MSTAYQRGRRFEYRVRDHLRERGFFVVRAAKSKGVADLIAIRRGDTPLLVQCKGGRRGGSASLPPDEWNALYDAALAAGAIPLLACRVKRRIRFVRLTGRKDGARREVAEAFEIVAPRENSQNSDRLSIRSKIDLSTDWLKDHIE